jgi:hypothetical protein
MTFRSLIARTATWGLAACLIVGSAGEASVAYRVPLVHEAARTARGGGSAADRSRREDLLRWLRTETAADQTDPEHDTRPATAASAVAALPSGDNHLPSSTSRTPVRCRST